MDAAAPHDRIDRVDNMLEELKNKSPDKIKGVILDHFHWYRIVMDEGHEVIEDEFITGKHIFVTKFEWCLQTAYHVLNGLTCCHFRCDLLPPTNLLLVHDWHSVPEVVSITSHL